ncbi:MAG: hypothetical protein K9K38_04755 [Rhodoferax sp.]|nr:hypothetical protein [Rhodoferax sp.]MCF8208702.1 hypothetical protein [Rhodoferax sp.]
MKPNDEPPLWLTVLKLVVGLLVIVGSVGLALWLALDQDQKNAPAVSPEKSWGIANDSPIRRKL